jgi:hypothetical protein
VTPAFHAEGTKTCASPTIGSGTTGDEVTEMTLTNTPPTPIEIDLLPDRATMDGELV